MVGLANYHGDSDGKHVSRPVRHVGYGQTRNALATEIQGGPKNRTVLEEFVAPVYVDIE